MERRYNLIDEKWIPISGQEPVSLKDVFSDEGIGQLGGTSVQKLAVLKLLLAIAQRACTPSDAREWEKIGTSGLGAECLGYLQSNYDSFYLYGEDPFLQLPILAQMQTKKGEPIPIMPIGRPYHPDIPSDNDTVINQLQLNRIPTDAQKALFIVSIMNYSLGGKRVTNIAPLSEGFSDRSVSAKSGPSLGNYHGYLQSCLWGRSVLETVWLNLFTRTDLAQFPQWEHDELIPPWERMPLGEDDENARHLKASFMCTLVALSRFVYLQGDGILYVEGLQYPSHKNGWREPFMMLRSTKDGEGVMFLDPTRKPWRSLSSLLALSLADSDSGVTCPQVQLFLKRAREAVPVFGVYSGGLKVRANAGDQSVKQEDDFIDSCVWLESKALGEPFYKRLEGEMQWLERVAYILKKSVEGYYKDMKETKAAIHELTEADFWRFAETVFQDLVIACDKPEGLAAIRRSLRSKAMQLYDVYCQRETARQIECWVRNRPRFKYEINKEV